MLKKFQYIIVVIYPSKKDIVYSLKNLIYRNIKIKWGRINSRLLSTNASADELVSGLVMIGKINSSISAAYLKVNAERFKNKIAFYVLVNKESSKVMQLGSAQ